MDDNQRHIIAITAFIRNKSGSRFLIVKRSHKEIAYPGKWAFPGGKVEKGSNILETLKREILEEVGIEIEDYKRYLKDYTFIRPDAYNVVGFCFEVIAKSEDVKISDDFEDFRWIRPDELKNFDSIPGMEQEVNIAFNI
jgi:nucleoside triphosphatase